jgi:hypothetical protein
MVKQVLLLILTGIKVLKEQGNANKNTALKNLEGKKYDITA